MKNLLLSVVLITALAFVFLACTGDDEETIDLYVTLAANGFWTDDTIGVDTPDIEGIEFEWYKSDSPLSILGTSSTFKPGTGNGPGKYTVSVTAGEQIATASFLVAPEALKNTDNTWYMNRTATGNGSPNYNETVEITPTKFDLKEFPTNPTATAGSLTITITDWAVQSSRPAAISGSQHFGNADYTSGWKATIGSISATGDYDKPAPNAMTEFYIFTNSTGGRFVRSSAQGTTAPFTPVVTDRFYEKNKAGSGWN
jgi:hypothetical protein